LGHGHEDWTGSLEPEGRLSAMAIKLPKETASKLKASLTRFFDEELEQQIGEIKANLVLDYMLAEIGPVIYNQAIKDAESYLTERMMDLEGVCYEKEFTYWADKSKPRQKGVR
jgi:uncharacterized protein (DUF2164 family)